MGWQGCEGTATEAAWERRSQLPPSRGDNLRSSVQGEPGGEDAAKAGCAAAPLPGAARRQQGCEVPGLR